MRLRVRRATRDDAEAVARLGYELNVHQGDPVAHFGLAAVLGDGFGAEPEFRVFLAELDGEAVGYALFHDAYETARAASGIYLADLHVTEAARRNGVGRALVAAVARDAKRRGRSFVWWASKPWNREAQAFYRAIGADEEPIVAHALTGAAMETLAAEDMALEAAPP